MNNKNSVSYLWAVAGAYLIYLGAKQIIALFDGTASIPVVTGLSGIIFIVFGGAVLYREWKNYRRAQNGTDDEIVDAEESEVSHEWNEQETLAQPEESTTLDDCDDEEGDEE